MRVPVVTAGVLLATGIVLYPFTLTPVTGALVVVALLAAASFVSAVLLSQWFLFGAGMALFAAEYSISLLVGEGRLDLLAPVVGVCCLALFELTGAAATLSGPAPIDRPLLRARAREALRVAAAGGAAAGAVLLAGTVPGGHPVVLIIGAAGGLGALAIAVYLVFDIVHPDEL